ncbi:concanavalin A-like lectin/glucanase domain-containing protein [Aspergillus cavernicola]|uniref:Concanavalin A-like lectin/glucanase domain-containing protein n=1 Tax=Aspergillus cavernicola TaxID=176166 RepID=A0ABR4IK71_9EURO
MKQPLLKIILFLSTITNANPFAALHHHRDRSLADPLTSLLPLQLQGYTLTWHDEFTSPSSSSSENSHLPSSTNWLYDTGTSYPLGAPAWGNNELECYTTTPQNIHLTPSNTLAITPIYNPQNHTWTSARIETTRSDFAAPPGGKLYIESRLRTGCAPASQQQGIWPAFWALGRSFRADPTDWPMSSEWDFVEVINGDDTVYNTLHCGVEQGEGGPCNEYNGLGNGGVQWEGCIWHVIGFEVDRSSSSSLFPSSGNDDDSWEEETLKWFIDGEQTWEVSGADVGDFEVWERVAHQGHFLLLNVAVGGNWPGYPDENTIDGEEVQMEVDYVRVWNLD